MDVDHKSEMEDILNKAELSELLQKFIAEKVEPETITAATDLALVRLGVATIGDKVRLRKACRKREKEPHHSDTNGNSRAAFEYGIHRQQETWKGVCCFSQGHQIHIEG